MTTKENQEDQVRLTIELSPAEVDAGAELTVTVRVASPPEQDFSGRTVLITDRAGAELARVELAEGEPDDDDDDDDADDESDDDDDEEDDDELSAAFGVVVVRAPSVAGNHILRAVLAAADDEGADDLLTAEASFVVTGHAATVSAWGVSSATAAGERASLTVGVKCSCGCNLAGRPYRVLDQDGREAAAGVLRADVWPKTTALYYDQAEATAPPAVGLHAWTVETPEWNGNGLPHAAGSAAFNVNVVAPPDFEITVETIDGEKQTPVKGMHVLFHPYRTLTDEHGIARIKVAKGRYRLNISGFKYAAYQDFIEADDDLVLRAELYIEPDDQPYMPRVEPPPTKFSVLRKGQQ